MTVYMIKEKYNTDAANSVLHVFADRAKAELFCEAMLRQGLDYYVDDIEVTE